MAKKKKTDDPLKEIENKLVLLRHKQDSTDFEWTIDDDQKMEYLRLQMYGFPEEQARRIAYPGTLF